jgi:hypothetical protein
VAEGVGGEVEAEAEEADSLQEGVEEVWKK